MSLPLHISTTMGRELTLMAAQARPTRAKTMYMAKFRVEKAVVSRKPVKKQAASSAQPARMVFRRPTLEATAPMGM